MMRQYTLVFFFLALISVAFALGHGYRGHGGHRGHGHHGPGHRGSGGVTKRKSLLGKLCGWTLDCGFGFLYCIDGTCQKKVAGRDCVGEGDLYTGDGSTEALVRGMLTAALATVGSSRNAVLNMPKGKAGALKERLSVSAMIKRPRVN
ncbi:hypothetical protein [Absidia glauca]|uniref:Uncharacterized protein n=1 Tax=Absidia glauca TaxID=4829 RepID=A0A168QN69_ABSGL|nr:hypothetical protein [Absidia glauca]